jgi:hypothetical protein
MKPSLIVLSASPPYITDRMFSIHVQGDFHSIFQSPTQGSTISQPFQLSEEYKSVLASTGGNTISRSGSDPISSKMWVCRLSPGQSAIYQGFQLSEEWKQPKPIMLNPLQSRCVFECNCLVSTVCRARFTNQLDRAGNWHRFHRLQFKAAPEFSQSRFTRPIDEVAKHNLQRSGNLFEWTKHSSGYSCSMFQCSCKWNTLSKVFRFRAEHKWNSMIIQRNVIAQFRLWLDYESAFCGSSGEHWDNIEEYQKWRWSRGNGQMAVGTSQKSSKSWMLRQQKENLHSA